MTSGSHTVDNVLLQVRRVQRSLAGVIWARIALQTVGTALACLWISTRLRELAAVYEWLPVTPTSAPLVVALFAAVMLGGTLLRRYGAVTPLRTALWIEERQSTGYALVTWVEHATVAAVATPSGWLADRIAAAAVPSLTVARTAIRKFARLQLTGPALFVMGLVGVMIASPPYSSPSMGVHDDAGGSAGVRVGDMPLGSWQVRISPPAYTGLPAQTLDNVHSLVALSGTVVEVIGSDATPDSARLRQIADSTTPVQRIPVRPDRSAWMVHFVAVEHPQELRIWRRSHARLLLVEGVADSIPRVTLMQPVRDSVLRQAVGRVPLVASVHDDLGMQRALFEVVISSGEGELFTARTLSVGAHMYDGARAPVRDDTIRGELDIGGLNLKAGDVVHVRAVARDRHPLASREMGVSETRAFRIARASEYDSVAVEPAPPPAVDSSLLSQRMLLLLTERLEARRPGLAISTLQDESRKLARDQGRLRQSVGDAVFQRLSGDAGGEHSHFAGDGHEHGVEEIGGKLGMSGVNALGVLEEGDDSPVLAINKPLLEAYNAMWDAGRALEQSDTRGAIPFMRMALAAIERARTAERLYLRGRPPMVIIDIGKVRMTGKDTGASNARSTRPALPRNLALKEVRLLRAGELLHRDVFAARDSFAVLRLESLQDAPVFAKAVAELVNTLDSATTLLRSATGSQNAARPVDLTEALLHARRVLGNLERLPQSNWSRGGPPE